MEKYIPYEKLSKKEKRKINNKRRRTWGGINPITRKRENSKAYSRKRISTGRMNLAVLILFLLLYLHSLMYEKSYLHPLYSVYNLMDRRS